MHKVLDRIILISLAALVVALGVWQGLQVWADETPTSDYRVVEQPESINLSAGTSASVRILIKNTGDSYWSPTQLALGTVYWGDIRDRASIWKTDSWTSPYRIKVSNNTIDIAPGQAALFEFEIKAPSREGIYQERFQPVLDGVRWLEGSAINLNIQVGTNRVSTVEPKEVRIYRGVQQADLLENGVIVATLPISTGKAGYETPRGNYRIINHTPDAYSNKYKLWMPNWMGLSSDTRGYQGYGLHSLPYWKVNPKNYIEGHIYPGGRLYTQGRLYEGYSHLGTGVSHGCVRFGIRESGLLFNWAPDKTRVVVF